MEMRRNRKNQRLRLTPTDRAPALYMFSPAKAGWQKTAYVGELLDEGWGEGMRLYSAQVYQRASSDQPGSSSSS
eukprot:6186854-Pleurochrysis_carterae.AAC.2